MPSNTLRPIIDPELALRSIIGRYDVACTWCWDPVCIYVTGARDIWHVASNWDPLVGRLFETTLSISRLLALLATRVNIHLHPQPLLQAACSLVVGGWWVWGWIIDPIAIIGSYQLQVLVTHGVEPQSMIMCLHMIMSCGSNPWEDNTIIRSYFQIETQFI